jgi:hypothetical protein
MKNLTPEMIEKAKAAKSTEELLALAKENNVEMTADEAATYFAQLNPKSGELDDDDLDNVAGGACGVGSDSSNRPNVRLTNGRTCPKCGSNIGFVVVKSQGFGNMTEEIYCCKDNSLIFEVFDTLGPRPYEPLN